MANVRMKEEASGPVIGISAVADGREAAMARQKDRVGKMMRMLAQFAADEHRHIDGRSPRVVAANELVRDAASAQRVGRQFRFAGVEVLVCYDDVWAYPGELEGLLLQNVSAGQIPVAHVSGNSAAWPGVVYNFAATGMLAQWGYFTHRIVGDLVEKDGAPTGFSDGLKADILDWLAAATTFADMWGTPYASFGGHSMNMETGLAHVIQARRYFGLNTIHVDMMEIWGRIKGGRYDKEAGDVVAWLRKMMPGRINTDSKDWKAADLEASLAYQAKMYLAMKEIMGELGATVGGFQGQRQWTDYLATGDVPEAVLNDNFDHTGRKLPIAFATENDFNRGVTQRISVGLSGGLPALFMDFRKAYFPDDPLIRKNAGEKDKRVVSDFGGVADFCNSGNHPPFYGGLSTDDPADNYESVSLWPVIKSYFPGGGFSVEFNASPCDMLFSGLALRPDNAFVMQAALGRSVPLSDKLAKAINGASDPTWPHLYGVFDDPMREIVDTWASNHAVGVYAFERDRMRRRMQYWSDIARVPLTAFASVAKGGRTLPLQFQMYGGQTEGCKALGPRG